MADLKLKFKMPDDESLANYISIKGEKGDRGDPTKLSELANDTGFITASTDELTNYYTKSQTDSALDEKVDSSTFEDLEIPSDFFAGAETVTETGVNMSIENTSDSEIKAIILKGNTSQDGTPTPDDPVDVDVVTGVQTIEITGNGATQKYTVDLGDIELCKLGEFQDYIYEAGGHWYIHKETAKVTLNGSESWYLYNGNFYIQSVTNYNKSYNIPFSETYRGAAMTTGTQTPSASNYDTVRFSNSSTEGFYRLFIIDPDFDNSADFKAWLSENNVSVYYVLASATESPITDAALIAQLNKLNRVYTYNGTTAIRVDGTLAAILTIEAFKNDWSGSISGVNKELDQIDDVLFSENYYDEITYTKERYFDTDCYFTSVPMEDAYGDEIELYIGDTGTGGTPLQYAQENHTTLTTNATLNLGGAYGVGSVIANGKIIRDVDTTAYAYSANRYLGLKANREIVEYQFNQTSAQDMLNDGCVQAWHVFYKILDNGVVLDMSNLDLDEPTTPTAKHPRQCLGQMEDGTIVILTCDGRTNINAGLTSEETAQLLLNKGCVNAWNLDGGGSSSTEIKESKLNRNIDGDGTKDRVIRYTLNVKKPTRNTEIAKVYTKISKEKQNIIQQIIPLINKVGDGLLSTNSVDISGSDLNTLVDKIYIAYGNSLTNRPAEENIAGGYFINIPHSWDEFIGLYAKQYFLSRETDKVYTRQLVNGTFSNWVRLSSSEKATFTSGDTQTVQSTSTYETILLRASERDGSSITPAVYEQDETHFNGFKVNRTGYVKIKAQLQLTASTTGAKFMSFYRGDTQIGSSIVRFTGQQGIETIATTETITNNTNVDNVYYLKIFGSAGDTISRAKVNVEIG